jgi:methionyl-tRNA formyltransferase
LRIVFLGTPDFAVPALDKLHERFTVVASVSQPDRERDRKGRLLAAPVKKRAEELGIPVYQFANIKAETETLQGLDADLFVTAAYGQILSRAVLDIPRHGVFNIHASLLPKYRGAAPVQWAVANGESVTGVTVMRTAPGVDTGDILLSRRVEIAPEETAPELLQRLSVIGAEAVLEAVSRLAAGTAAFTKQDETQATYFPMLRKTDGELDFTQSAAALHALIRGFYAFPGCYTFLGERALKVYRAVVLENETPHGDPGTVVRADSAAGLCVRCGKGVLRLAEIQLAGGKRLSDTEFLKGHRILPGAVL